MSQPASETRVRQEHTSEEEALVRVENLTKQFPITRGIIFQKQIAAVHAVEDISFSVFPGETLGLVGESGCGKSTTARLITKLIEPSSGHIWFEGEDISGYTRGKMRPLRREMQMIFQDPYASLNPRKTVGQVIGSPYRIHKTE